MASGVCSVAQPNGGSGDQVGSGQERRTKLILNYLSQTVTKADIRALFATIGEIQSCKLVKNQFTGQSLGYGFVNYLRPEDAKKAINKLNGWALHNKAMKVSYARDSDSFTRTNLFVSGLPKNLTNPALDKIFCAYGQIITSHILRDFKTGISKGVGFVRFNRHLEAEQAIQKLNGTKPTNFTETINVKFAYDTSKNNKFVPSLLGHCPPLFARQFPGPFHCPIPIRHFSYSSMVVDAPPISMYPECAMNGSGWCIFIYNLATDADESVLWYLFGPFGAVQNVTIIRDLQTNMCKGFGFVTMAKYDEAVIAIQSLNGYIFNYRKLQVRFKTKKNKTPNDHNDNEVKRVRFTV